jgi:hypothetical protein
MQNESAIPEGAEAPLAYPVSDLPRIIGIGKTKIFAEIKAKRLAAKKCGSKTIVLADAARAYLLSLPDAAA